MRLAEIWSAMIAHQSAHRLGPSLSLAVGVETLESRSLLSVMAGGTGDAATVQLSWSNSPMEVQGHYQWGRSFQDPPQIVSHNGVLKVTLVASQQTVMIGGKAVLAMVYNGSYVGPTLRVRPGDTLIVTLVNHMNETTNLHFHGLHVSPSGNAETSSCRSPREEFPLRRAHPQGPGFGNVLVSLARHDARGGAGLWRNVGRDYRRRDKILPAGSRHITEHTFDLKDFQVDDQGG